MLYTAKMQIETTYYNFYTTEPGNVFVQRTDDLHGYIPFDMMDRPFLESKIQRLVSDYARCKDKNFHRTKWKILNTLARKIYSSIDSFPPMIDKHRTIEVLMVDSNMKLNTLVFYTCRDSTWRYSTTGEIVGKNFMWVHKEGEEDRNLYKNTVFPEEVHDSRSKIVIASTPSTDRTYLVYYNYDKSCWYNAQTKSAIPGIAEFYWSYDSQYDWHLSDEIPVFEPGITWKSSDVLAKVVIFNITTDVYYDSMIGWTYVTGSLVDSGFCWTYKR